MPGISEVEMSLLLRSRCSSDKWLPILPVFLEHLMDSSNINCYTVQSKEDQLTQIVDFNNCQGAS